jgi:hypothetical protein
MSTVRISLGMTISIGGKGSFEFFKPEMEWEIDTEMPLEPQFEACKKVTKETWRIMADTLENHIKEEMGNK